MSTILIVDDEPGIREVLQDILEDEEYQVVTAEDGVEGLQILKSRVVDLVILDVWLPKMGGIEVLEHIKADYPQIEVIIISGHANIDMAVKAIKLGAFDMMEKPLSIDRVITLVRNALTVEALKRENRQLKHSLDVQDAMLGKAAQLDEIRAIIAQAAPSNATVFITGENGTGKELVARKVHEGSPRRNGPFVAVNCAAIPENLIESELFGHEKGAFTGAVSRKRGKFEVAAGGTLFLDEIADLSLSAQAKILRAVQELKIERLGGEETIDINVRVVAATNKNMQTEISEGRFREDLFYRLHVVPVAVPPLRERKEDIPLLGQHFLDVFQFQLLGQDPEAGQRFVLRDEAVDRLKQFPWPGNVRQFKNVMQRLVVFSENHTIHAEAVDGALAEERRDIGANKDGLGGLDKFFVMGLNEAKDEFERRYILQKLEENEYNISKAATAMGIYPSNLHGKMKKFGIEKP
ncbi:sigma-54-dependent transcriptional regulator [Spirochaeta lutea]|uniref:Fis family transcriptional regulator n=1 Tax=Spirochaeta lutea TaxID=1480694 RepID=A0A098QWV6_9SPIO|nr:sigma-54 dependent transcriptional regulator [Spirochaeta lutea]KGE71873.1 Fis family transcriptional regulator [Spirochaeta lutea]